MEMIVNLINNFVLIDRNGVWVAAKLRLEGKIQHSAQLPQPQQLRM